jgi:hypothetical protein
MRLQVCPGESSQTAVRTAVPSEGGSLLRPTQRSFCTDTIGPVRLVAGGVGVGAAVAPGAAVGAVFADADVTDGPGCGVAPADRPGSVGSSSGGAVAALVA